MTAEGILQEVRRACARGDADSPESVARLEKLAQREGVSTELLRLLRDGPLADANLAAIALRHVQSPIVRRGLVRDAAKATGERRSAWLLALTNDELAVALAKEGRALGLELLYEMGLVAVRDPRGFVELACRDVPAADERIVDLCERVRARYGLSAAAMYGPLLERPLVPSARARVVSLLGREPGEAAQRVLEKEQSRAEGSAAAVVRRERLRQATRALESEAPATKRDGAAVLSPLTGDGDWSLEIFEVLGPGQLLVFGAVLKAGGAAELFTGTEEATLALADERIGHSSGLTRITRAQARALLESTGRRARSVLAPALDRLADVEPAPGVAPAPGSIGEAEAFELVSTPLWSAWRPFAKSAAETESEIDAPDADALLAWAEAHAPEVVSRALAQRGGAGRLAAALSHQSFVLHARGDERASAVAAEAMQIPRRRPGPVLLALATLELLRRVSAT